jgi:hypothetical protein
LSCNDGNGCTDDSCHPALGCVHSSNTAACDDGNACTTGDACSAGSCVGGGALGCNDGNGCTDDSCNPAVGCVHADNTAACDDGNACTTNDTCSAGACEGGAALSCGDGDVCTADGCDPAVGCVTSTPNLNVTGFSATRIDGRDLVVLADAWNSCPGDARYDGAANLDGDTTLPGACVDAADFHQFMNAYGHACP